MVAGDGGVKMIKLGSMGLGNVFVLAQDSVSDVYGLKVARVGEK